MLVFPNCKINIGLNIVRKRSDGFHDLETIFYPVKNLYDALEVVKDDGWQMVDGGKSTNHHPPSTTNLTSSGLLISGETTSNLCIKAYNLLKKDFPGLPNIQMHLHKIIPMGAGLGGGSADGAFTLSLLNDKFQLYLSKQQLIDYALQLGSDCPFFIYNQPSFATGRGEKIQPVGLDLSNYSIVLVNPNIHINTGWAFGQVIPQQPPASLKDLIQQPILTWEKSITNDFEASVIKLHLLVGGIKEKLYKNGAVYAAMSGSGSTLFGIFEKADMPKKKLFDGFSEWHLDL